MKIKCIINGLWKENCYIISKNNGGVIIDPGGNEEQIHEYLIKNKIKVHSVINTHAHYDHIGAVSYLLDEYKCIFYVHSQDAKLLKSANLYRTLFGGKKNIKIPKVDLFLDEARNPLVFNELSIGILSTPGHTDGSVCFLIGDNLFTGDTLLKGKVGRVDLPGGNKEKLKSSLLMISGLPIELTIYPGHGEPSSLAEELSSNFPFIKSIQ